MVGELAGEFGAYGRMGSLRGSEKLHWECLKSHSHTLLYLTLKMNIVRSLSRSLCRLPGWVGDYALEYMRPLRVVI